MLRKFYKVCIRLGAVLCAYSLVANIFDLNLPLKGSIFIDVAFIAIWVLSEMQWRKESEG